jgi:hypothetical protein
MTDQVSPSYFALKREGGVLPCNDMSQVKRTFILDENNYKHRHWYNIRHSDGATTARSHYYGNLATSYLYSFKSNLMVGWSGAIPSTPDANAAQIEALARARSEMWDVSTFVAEWGKMTNMVGKFRSNVLSRAERVASSRGGAHAIAERGLSGFFQTWLEGRYGWRTLAYDITDINLTLLRLKYMADGFIRKSATDSNTSSRVVYNHPSYIAKHYGPSLQVSSSNWCNISGSTTQTYEAKVHCGVMIEKAAQAILSVDPLSTVYEVIPYSFVLDWFTNLGKALRAFSPFAQGSIVAGYQSTISTVTTTTIATPIQYDWGSTYESRLEGPLSSDTLTVVDKTYERLEALPSFSVVVDINLDTLKMVDLLGLFWGKWAGLLKTIRKQTRI